MPFCCQLSATFCSSPTLITRICQYFSTSHEVPSLSLSLTNFPPPLSLSLTKFPPLSNFSPLLSLTSLLLSLIMFPPPLSQTFLLPLSHKLPSPLSHKLLSNSHKLPSPSFSQTSLLLSHKLPSLSLTNFTVQHLNPQQQREGEMKTGTTGSEEVQGSLLGTKGHPISQVVTNLPIQVLKLPPHPILI